MLGLLLLSTAAIAGIVATAGLFDDNDQSPEQAIDDADLQQDLGLLDETEITALETALAQDPSLAAGALESEDDLLLPYRDENGFADIQGSDGRDLIVIPEEVGADHDAVFGNDGDDVVLGNDANDAIFGDDGNDLLFGRGGDDYLFGDAGDDTISGGTGDDLVVGGNGSEVLYGGAGNDNVFDGRNDRTHADEDRADVIVAGDGDDGVVIEDGINLLSLGEGNDHVMVYTESGDNPGAVITDFNPQEDALLLGVYAPDITLPDGVSSVELGYTLSEINTELGPATLVVPASTEGVTAETLGDGSSVGYAVLLGVTPAELAEVEIRVVLQTGQIGQSDASIDQIADEMGATRL